MLVLPRVPVCLRRMGTTRKTLRAAHLLITWLLVRMAGVAECDPVTDHWSAPEEARPLDGVLAEPVADRVHRRLQARVPWFGGSREQIQLAGAGVAQAREADAQRADG